MNGRNNLPVLSGLSRLFYTFANGLRQLCPKTYENRRSVMLILYLKT